MTSLVIVEAERGVTHLMLILDLDGANGANGREADEQETQQLRQRVHQLEQELACAQALTSHANMVAAHAQTQVEALRRQVQCILEVVTAPPHGLLLQGAWLPNQDMLQADLLPARARQSSADAMAPGAGQVKQSAEDRPPVRPAMRTADLARLVASAAEGGMAERVHQNVIDMHLVQAFAHHFEQAGGTRVAFALCDVSGAVLWANGALTSACGYSCDEMLGCCWQAAFFGPLSHSSGLSRVDAMMQLRLPLSS